MPVPNVGEITTNMVFATYRGGVINVSRGGTPGYPEPSFDELVALTDDTIAALG